MAPQELRQTITSMNRAEHETHQMETASAEYPADAVVSIAERLDAAGVRYWIDGGWGVDALLGHQTRPHSNLNLAVALADKTDLAAVLRGSGYTLVSNNGGVEHWATENGLEIEVGYVDISHTRRAEDGELVYGDRGLPYPVGAFGAIGTIGGVDVPCCHADYQMWSHVGHDDIGRRDMLALHRRFGLPLPD